MMSQVLSYTITMKSTKISEAQPSTVLIPALLCAEAVPFALYESPWTGSGLLMDLALLIQPTA